VRNLIPLALVATLLAPGVTAAQGFDHGPLDTLLRANVHADTVDYAALAKSAELRAYVAALGKTDPATLPDRASRLAFWINAYNAFTITGVLGYYPGITSVAKMKPDFGFFKDARFVVGGKKLSLNQIENEIIRPRFHDPRVHAALNCASVSCPPLAPHAFTAAKLESQLDARMRAFVRDPKRNHVDPAAGPVRVSPIFKWYAEDFKPRGGAAAFIAGYLDGPSADAVRKTAKLEFLEYDWALNGK